MLRTLLVQSMNVNVAIGFVNHFSIDKGIEIHAVPGF